METRKSALAQRVPPLQISNQTLNTLTLELSQECQTVIALIHQLQLPDLTPAQQADILANLLASAIHLHTHCDSDFQTLIADALEALPDPEDD